MVLNKAHVEPEAKPNQRKLGPERAAEHVYCLKDGKTGWQNLYIGKKIEKRGRRGMYTA